MLLDQSRRRQQHPMESPHPSFWLDIIDIANIAIGYRVVLCIRFRLESSLRAELLYSRLMLTPIITPSQRPQFRLNYNL